MPLNEREESMNNKAPQYPKKHITLNNNSTRLENKSFIQRAKNVMHEKSLAVSKSFP